MGPSLLAALGPWAALLESLGQHLLDAEDLGGHVPRGQPRDFRR